MRTITRWNPYREMISLRNMMDQMLEQSFNSRFSDRISDRIAESNDSATSLLSLPVDMYEKNGEFVIRTDLPGLKAEDIDIRINDNALTIKGEFKQEQEEQSEDVHFQELHYGKFHRTVNLPSQVDSDQVEATFENGVLKVNLPKTEETQPKQISVKSRS